MIKFNANRNDGDGGDGDRVQPLPSSEGAFGDSDSNNDKEDHQDEHNRDYHDNDYEAGNDDANDNKDNDDDAKFFEWLAARWWNEWEWVTTWGNLSLRKQQLRLL